MKATRLWAGLMLIFTPFLVTAMSLPLTTERVSAAEQSAIAIDGSPSAQIEQYLQTAFCRDNLCPSGEWSRWIVVSEESVWTVAEIQLTRQTLLNSLEALAKVGLDGHELLNGYRFRRFDGNFMDDVEQRYGMVRHSTQEITLADAAFDNNGFTIYHEIGHVIDRQLNRHFTDQYHAQAGGRYYTLNGVEGWATANGYWFRTQGRVDRQEAAADAFAVWVIVGYAGLPDPVFIAALSNVDYPGIVQLVQTVLVEAALSSS